MSRGALVWASRQWGPFQTLDGRLVEPKAADQLVLFVLADLCDRTTHCAFPSRAYIQRRTLLSRSRVGDALQLWLDCGLIRAEVRYGQRGRQTSNAYKMLLHRGKRNSGEGSPAIALEPVDKSVDNSPVGDPILDPPPIDPGGSKMDPLDPGINHQKRIASSGGGVDNLEGDEKESPAAMEKDAPHGAKSVSQVNGARASRKPREYLVSNLRRARKDAGVQ